MNCINLGQAKSKKLIIVLFIIVLLVAAVIVVWTIYLVIRPASKPMDLGAEKASLVQN